jgi:hypothetical protein
LDESGFFRADRLEVFFVGGDMGAVLFGIIEGEQNGKSCEWLTAGCRNRE